MITIRSILEISQNPDSIAIIPGFEVKFGRCLLTTLILMLPFSIQKVAAQPITSANDGTGTLVIVEDGTHFKIMGGTQVGPNLFHSLEQFSLNAEQSVNFMVIPTTQNVLGRVVGGNASFINGLVQLTGANANLFLINPAGIFFGPQAALAVPGSFTATTANGVQIGESWFKAMGSNDYGTLFGTPNGFAFTTSQSGAIVNTGNLAVSQGNSITLLGGMVINTGTITTPGGNVTIASVPGENYVRITPQGSLLSLDLPIDTQTAINGEGQPLTPESLPQLLAGGNASQTGLVVEGDTVKLGDSGMEIPQTAGTTIVSGTVETAISTPGETGGRVQILGDKVGVVNAQIDASGASGGGTVLIGGDYQGKGTVPNASRTFVDKDSVVISDGLIEGDGGRVIVWGDDTTRFYGKITARGGVNRGDGGFVEVSGKQYLDFQGLADLSAAKGQFGTLLLDPTNITVVAGGNNPPELTANDQFADPGVNNTINNGTINAATANVTLQATNDITFDAPVNMITPGVGLTAQAGNAINVNESLTTNNGDINLTANAGGIFIGSLINSGGGNINFTGINNNGDGVSINLILSPNNIISSQGGDITITGQGINDDIFMFQGEINSGGGNIIFVGNSNVGNNIFIRGTIDSQNGDILIQADLIETSDSVNINGSGVLTFQPSNPNSDIQIGGTFNPGQNGIDFGVLDGLADGFSQIIIGGTNSSGAITLAENIAFDDPVIIRSPVGNGSINTTGFTLTAPQLTTIAGDNITVDANVTTTGGNVVFTADADNSGIGALIVTNAAINTNGGNVNLTSNQINVSGEITTTGGVIEINGNDGINTTGGRLDSSSTTQIGGNITVLANGDINVGDIDASSSAIVDDNSSIVTLNSRGGTVTTTGIINSSSFNSLNGELGTISITANEINLEGGASSITGGQVSLNPNTGNVSEVQIGDTTDSSPQVLDLTTTDLNAINSFDLSIGDPILGDNFVSNIGSNSSPVDLSTTNILFLTLNSSSIVFNNSLILCSSCTLNVQAFELSMNSSTNNIPDLIGGSLRIFNNRLVTIGTVANPLEMNVGEIDLDTGTGNIFLRNQATLVTNINDRALSNFNISSTNGNITFNNSVNGNFNLTLDAGNNVIFNSEVGNNTPLVNLTVNSPIELNGSVTTVEIQTYNDSVTLRSNTSLTGTSLILSQGLNGNNNDLTLSFTSPVTVSSAILSNLNNFAVNGSGTTNISGDFTTSGNQTYNTPVSLNNNTSLTGNNLTLTQGLNGNNNDLTLNFTDGVTISNATISNLNNFAVNGSGITNISGDFTTSGNQTYNTPVILNNNTSLTGNNLTLTQRLNGNNNDLTLNFSNGITLSNTTISNLNNFTVNGSETTNISGNFTTSGNQIYNTPVSLNNNTTLTGNGLTLTQGLNGNNNDLILSFTNPVTISNAILSNLNNFTVNGSGITNISGDFTTSGSQTYNSPVSITGTTIRGQKLTFNQLITGKNINLLATDNIKTADINTSLTDNTGGNVTLRSNNGIVETGNINTSGTSGGNLLINAQVAITTGEINTSGTIGDGGNVTLDPESDIQVVSINAQGGANGSGGDVDMTTNRFFRATGAFIDQNGILASISSAGGIEGGTVTIRYRGTPETTFDIGDATKNGTLGAITTGLNNTLTPLQFILGSFSQGKINIINTAFQVSVNTDQVTNTNEEIIQDSKSAQQLEPETTESIKDIQALENSQQDQPIVMTVPNTNTRDIRPVTPAEIYAIEEFFSGKIENYYTKKSPKKVEDEEPSKNGIISTRPQSQPPTKKLEEIRRELADIEKATGVKPAIIYVLGSTVSSLLEVDIELTPYLQLVVVTSEGEPIKLITQIAPKDVLNAAKNLRDELEPRSRIKKNDYLTYAQQLYQYLISPLEEVLKERKINNLVFVMDNGLRSIPLAALHDGKNFIIEKYSVGLMPSMSLTNTDYRNISKESVLTMGSPNFPQPELEPLPAVSIEVPWIKQQQGGEMLYQEAFKISNLVTSRQTFSILHLATHAEFNPGGPNQSHIYFFGESLTLDQLPSLNLNLPQVDLMVLSACETASGDREAELGFSGIAYQSGVKSVLGSIWEVNDLATLGLMTQFYQALSTKPIKAEALRQAQLALLKGEVVLKNGRLLAPGLPQEGIVIPNVVKDEVLKHPHFWSGLTIVGSPW